MHDKTNNDEGEDHTEDGDEGNDNGEGGNPAATATPTTATAAPAVVSSVQARRQLATHVAVLIVGAASAPGSATTAAN